MYSTCHRARTTQEEKLKINAILTLPIGLVNPAMTVTLIYGMYSRKNNLPSGTICARAA